MKCKVLQMIDRERRKRGWSVYRLAMESGRRISTIQGAMKYGDAMATTVESLAAAFDCELRLVPRRRRKG